MRRHRSRQAYKAEGDQARKEQVGGENNRNRDVWSAKTDMVNDTFEKYYRGNIVPEADWEPFMAALRRGLPTSIRMSWCDFASDAKLQQFMSGLAADLNSVLSTTATTGEAGNDDAAAAATITGGVRQLPFLPNAGLDVPELSRGDLKRSLGNRSAKTAIQCLSEAGLLSRQEVVSMVPPLLLDVQPGNLVLDLCAAPGSKTLQCLERLVRGPPGTATTTTAQGGCVVANDVNSGRLDVLQRQAGRSPFAASHLIVTNHDARFFPTSPGVRFDRVLCDAMCSGDGTLRKSPDLWQRWRPTSGAALHTQQRTVLYRGMQLCKAGGIVVYSTCSMNPIEDESVVAACLKDANGSFELMDPRALLPNLRFYPGQRSWKVMRNDGSWCESIKDITSTDAGAGGASQAADKKHIVPSMFPDFAAKETPNLEYCCRVVPHLQDTGGFFIAAMRCKAEIRSKKEDRQHAYQEKRQEKEGNTNTNNNDNDNDDDADTAEKKTATTTTTTINHQPPQKPIVPASQKLDGLCALPDNFKEDIKKSLHLPDSFPFQCFFSRRQVSREPKAYFVAGAAPSLMDQMDAKVVGLGVRAIESSTKHSFSHCRFAMEGAAVLAPFVPNLVIDVAAAPVFEAVKACMAESMSKKKEQGSNTAKQFETVNVPVPAGGRAHLPLGARHVLLRVKLGPHLVQLADAHTGQVLVVPAEVDYTGAAGTAAAKMTLNHMSLIAYSLGAMEGVAQWNELCGVTADKGGDDDDNNDAAGATDEQQPKPENSAAAAKK